MTISDKFRKALFTLSGILGLIYILNPSLGVFEILPDNLPILGNLDEATATYLIILALKEHGLDLTKFISSPKSKSKAED